MAGSIFRGSLVHHWRVVAGFLEEGGGTGTVGQSIGGDCNLRLVGSLGGPSNFAGLVPR